MKFIKKCRFLFIKILKIIHDLPNLHRHCRVCIGKEKHMEEQSRATPRWIKV